MNDPVIDNDIRAAMRQAKDLAHLAIDNATDSLFIVLNNATIETVVPLTMGIIVGMVGTMQGMRGGFHKAYPEVSKVLETLLREREDKYRMEHPL